MYLILLSVFPFYPVCLLLLEGNKYKNIGLGSVIVAGIFCHANKIVRRWLESGFFSCGELLGVILLLVDGLI